MNEHRAEEQQPEGWTPWDEVDANILEIEWFVSRKINLGASCERPSGTTRTWADVLASDIKALRESIAAARKTP